MKICTLCGLEKSLEDFPLHNKKGARHPRCKDCRSSEQRQRYGVTREYQLSRRLSETRKQIYNISQEDFESLLEQQDGRCAICSSVLQKPCIDHCHSTSKVRGILCQNCNTGLGMFNDSPSNLRKAADYIEKADTGFVANHQAIMKRWKRKR